MPNYLQTSIILFRPIFRLFTRNSSTSIAKKMTERKLHSAENRRHIIAVCQLTSTNDKEKNFETCQTLIRRASEMRAKMIFLPENFDYMGTSVQETKDLNYPEDDPYIDRYRQLARELKVWLSLGGYHDRDPDGSGRSRNTHLVLNDRGESVARYRKVHLFDVDILGQPPLKESDTTIRGDAFVMPVNTPIGKLGLSTCYDLRFPEQAQILRKAGAEVLTYPSAFTLMTGQAHWEPLLRARAIETQCYVAAAAQTGRHNDKRISYGHSMIVDPWGKVIAQCSEGVGLCAAEIDLDYMEDVRKQLPCHSHRREDVYTLASNSCLEDPDVIPHYQFGRHQVPSKHVFFRTPLSYAFVNRKPVVKGHVLVSPIRCMAKMNEMTMAEVADLFVAAQWVQRALEKFHEVTATTMTVQDGELAGQTVPHVHVHMLPRREGDFKENDIYKVLAEHDKGERGQTGFRNPDEMAQEAGAYRKLFYS